VTDKVEWRISFESGSVGELLSSLQYAERREERSRPQTEFLEALVERFKDVKIEIYANEHPPPHFHVKTNKGNASFTIADCALVDGDYFFSKRMKEIRVWHEKHRGELIECWNSSRPSDCPVGEFR
jgi:uncharacterized coiled-coil protein SlyX